MNKGRTRAAALAVVVSAAALCACGAGQAGRDYRGEPLMSLNGVVSANSSALREGLVPALLMRESESSTAPGSLGTAHFIQGEVEGTFPNAFTLRVYDPPPDTTLDALFDAEPAFGVAMITAVAPEHPEWLRTEEFSEPTATGEVLGEKICSKNQCYSGLFQCADGPSDPQAPWPCGSTFPDDLPWATYGYVAAQSVVYLAGPAAAGSVLAHMWNADQALAAGYHVFEHIDPTPEQLSAQTECTLRAEELALEEANDSNGTHWTQWPDDSAEHIRLHLKLGERSAAAEGCDTFMRVIGEHTDTQVELEFIDDPTLTKFL